MMTKEQIKEAAKAVIEAEKAVKAAKAVLADAQKVFTDAYREGYDDQDCLLQEINLINVDGDFWELKIDIDESAFEHLHHVTCTSVII
ncbi:hypothetical protein [Phormidium tenue]|jgi:hypothetical protein|uniref:Uncharacterized protein n=1 Tax=Phormidium tenue FACHB-1050 TaxID=2692857 RepID=A0ABR8C8L4_9CYAN|nr:hypothetical protein [Phormidium tenue]MBD2316705.1 hypothetical protein [Phormidium tenue FACHB-1050]